MATSQTNNEALAAQRTKLQNQLAALDSEAARKEQIAALKVEGDEARAALQAVKQAKPASTASTGPLDVYSHATDSERSFIDRIAQDMAQAVQVGGIRPALISELAAQLVPRLAAGVADSHANREYNNAVNALQSRLNTIAQRIERLEYPNGRPQI